MDAKADPLTDADEIEADEAEEGASAVVREPLDRHSPELERDEELVTFKYVEDAALKLYSTVQKGFEDQISRSDEMMDWWDVYHCKLGPRQFYSGNSKIFVPIVRNAVDARKTRFVNQVFPQSGRHVEVLSSDAPPSAITSLLEHYIRKSKLRTRVMPALVKNGDIEGQYNLYVTWIENKHHVAWRKPRPPDLDGVELDEDEGEDDIEETEIVHGFPHVEVLADSDVSVLPATADSVDDALSQGGSATIIRRWSESKIKQMIADGEIEKKRGRALISTLRSSGKSNQPDKQAKMVDAAGIKITGGSKFAQVYETWSVIKIKKERRLCRLYFGGEDKVLSVKRNPNWSDKCPLISAPVDKEQGAFKGISKIRAVADLQYAANDAVNEGMDSAAYALLPIIMTDPAKNPRVGSMVLSVAAIWETSPKDTSFANFPQLWKDAFEIVTAAKTEVNQTLSVSPAAIPQQASSGKRRMNQAEIANEQQVDVLTTADAVTTLEGEVLTPMLQRWLELDHQYRDRALTVPQFGEVGSDMNMEQIPPTQMHRRFEFRWYGVEAARSAQQMQQQISWMNVLRGLGPQAYPGYQLDLTPALVQITSNVMGPRIGPKILKDMRSQLAMDPRLENSYLEQAIDLPVHVLDNDAEHLQAHQQAMQMGDPSGVIRVHVMKHVMQMSQKTQQQAMQQQQAPGAAPGQGVPGMGGPGVAGTPRQGAQAGAQRNGQMPPGAIHRDQMRDPAAAPRR
jgi:hypothetical protein